MDSRNGKTCIVPEGMYGGTKENKFVKKVKKVLDEIVLP